MTFEEACLFYLTQMILLVDLKMLLLSKEMHRLSVFISDASALMKNVKQNGSSVGQIKQPDTDSEKLSSGR